MSSLDVSRYGDGDEPGGDHEQDEQDIALTTGTSSVDERAGLIPKLEAQDLKSSGKKAASGKALWKFPESWEKALAPFDDAVTRVLQRPDHRLLYIWNVYVIGGTFMFALTCIEFGVFCPLVLFAMGLDQQGTLATMLVLMLATLSQIPKRLIKRLRPWQTNRALKRRNDRTSSFPSRAVAGAVVYMFGACAAATLGPAGEVRMLGWFVPLILLAAALAAFARIQLGCHYASDCVAGALLGVVAVLLGVGFYEAVRVSCGTCYAAPGPQQLLLTAWSRINWVVLGVGSALAVALVVFAEVPPMYMWNKSAQVLGLLLPCIVVRVAVACLPVAGSAVVAPPMPPYAGSFFIGAGLAGATTGIAMLARGRWGIPVFVAVYTVNTVVMLIWRTGMP